MNNCGWVDVNYNNYVMVITKTNGKEERIKLNSHEFGNAMDEAEKIAENNSEIEDYSISELPIENDEEETEDVSIDEEEVQQIRYDDVKNKGGAVILNVRFYSHGDDEAYLPVLAKPVQPTKEEIEEYGTYQANDAIEEFCRIDLTKWKIIDAPDCIKKNLKNAIGKEVWLYYNGSEAAWKFFDPDGDIDKKNKATAHYVGNVSDNKIDKATDVANDWNVDFFYPHNDDEDTYGVIGEHAVYDMSVNKKSSKKKSKRHPEEIQKSASASKHLLELLSAAKIYVEGDIARAAEAHKKRKLSSVSVSALTQLNIEIAACLKEAGITTSIS